MGRGSGEGLSPATQDTGEDVKLFLDDNRPRPDSSWTLVKTADEAIEVLKRHPVRVLSLDNDLGQDSSGNELTQGRKVVDWMCRTEIWPTEKLIVHSGNTVAVDYMLGTIERYGPFNREGRSTKFKRDPQKDPAKLKFRDPV